MRYGRSEEGVLFMPARPTSQPAGSIPERAAAAAKDEDEVCFGHSFQQQKEGRKEERPSLEKARTLWPPKGSNPTRSGGWIQKCVYPTLFRYKI